MRPISIVNFERLYLLGLAIGLVNGIISFSSMQELIDSDPALSKVISGSTFIILTAGPSFVIALLLWFFIARRASNVAKWIFVVMFVIGLLMLPSSLARHFAVSQVSAIVSLGLTVLQAASIFFLFRADARAWFVSKGQNTADPDVFR